MEAAKCPAGAAVSSVSSVSSAAVVSREAFVEAMRAETQRVLGEVMEAVNHAPDGSWVDASEMPVRDLMGEYRRKVFETALRMRAEAAEGAFSPGGPGDGGSAQGQGPGPARHPDRQRPRPPAAAALAGGRRRRGGAGRRPA